MKTWVVIPAAGAGKRFATDKPKQYYRIADKTILEHTLACFAKRDDIAGIILAISATDEYIKQIDLPDNVHCVEGGKERSDSVLAALQYLQQIASQDDWVAVHDAARPCLSQQDIDAVLAKAYQSASGAILAAEVVDTVKQKQTDKGICTLDRSQILLALTPQVFKLHILTTALLDAQQKNIAITDEASAVEQMALVVDWVAGDKRNLKITTEQDLALATFYMQEHS